MALVAPMGAVMAWGYLGTPVTATDAAAIGMVVFGVLLPSLLERRRAVFRATCFDPIQTPAHNGRVGIP